MIITESLLYNLLPASFPKLDVITLSATSCETAAEGKIGKANATVS